MKDTLGDKFDKMVVTATYETTDPTVDSQITTLQASGADVLLVAHTGLDHLLTVADVWRELPMDKRLVMRWWRISRDQIPSGREQRIDWLFDQWRQIDDWVEEHRPVDLPRRQRAGAGSTPEHEPDDGSRS